jgi:hypothetical protein
MTAPLGPNVLTFSEVTKQLRTTFEALKPKRPCRPGKTAEGVIHEERVIHPERVPVGSRFLGYDDGVQDLRIELHNTRFRRACWRTKASPSRVSCPKRLRTITRVSRRRGCSMRCGSTTGH